MAPNTYEIGLLLFIKLETHDPNIGYHPANPHQTKSNDQNICQKNITLDRSNSSTK